MKNAINKNKESLVRKPSTAFLVVLNLLLFLFLVLPGSNLLGMILVVPAVVIFAGVSVVWQAILLFLDRRFHFHNTIRCIGFILPVTSLFLLNFFLDEPARDINKQYPAVSLSGDYKAFVSTKKSMWVWDIEIQDKSGETVYTKQTEFVSTLNIYWIWGPNERFWIYNSDDSGVHCWFLKDDNNWQYVNWGFGHTQETDVKLGQPPENLYPDYARQTLPVTETGSKH